MTTVEGLGVGAYRENAAQDEPSICIASNRYWFVELQKVKDVDAGRKYYIRSVDRTDKAVEDSSLAFEGGVFVAVYKEEDWIDLKRRKIIRDRTLTNLLDEVRKVYFTLQQYGEI